MNGYKKILKLKIIMIKNLKQNIDVSNLSNFKTKAFTKYFFEISTIEDIYLLDEILNFSIKNNLKTLFIWAWTNLLFAFDSFDWIIIKNNLKWFFYNQKTNILEVYSDELITQVALKLENDFNQNIWHRFIWLPWSVWWWVFWNAWCFWLEMENNFLKCEVYNFETKKIEVISKNKANFSYRSSIFKETWKYFIIKVFFDLSKVIEKYSSDVDNIKFREEIQPKWNSCWSFFKNPSKENTAWSLIEQVWLKWFIYNSAYFSDKHANFLMTNKDFWNYNDLIYLIDLVQNKVLEKFDIKLEPEVRIIKN